MTVFAWMVSQLRPDAPGFWLLLDLLIALGLLMAAAWAPMQRRALLRALRWLLIPYVALLAGAVSPQWMGLSGINWQAGLTLGLGFVGALLALLALMRLTQRDAAAAPPADGATVIYSLLAAGLEQFHWSFQRGALLLLLPSWPGGLESPAYWATWAAALLALPGVVFHTPGVARLYKGLALVATAILFFYTRNFWLCWLLHAGIMLFAGAAASRPELLAERRA